jgi:hypothetical protein
VGLQPLESAAFSRHTPIAVSCTAAKMSRPLDGEAKRQRAHPEGLVLLVVASIGVMASGLRPQPLRCI